ncbi:GNAT family N-acetyltransferase [Paucibacter sp. APW11]|uniref:GNAT family N-acetyltransferase n=1 Tax=Roseateles aquae TaxID=3077235 RepID=A0ABU3PC58_9BURK|nr:GNAT family N-acetyltransferase [Paucibacter sp. APW11]MDT9000108.1 GNAT family N-acetyltransferase [Paucibacter sp. APW11]
MADELNFRLATADDLPAVLDLLVAAGIDEREDLELDGALAIWPLMQARGAELLLMEQGEGPERQLLGTLTLYILPLLAHRQASEALVEDVAIAPEAQGRGLGRRLIQHAMQRASAAGCYKLVLSSNQRRVEAHAFYERLGFERHGFSFVVPLDATRG